MGIESAPAQVRLGGRSVRVPAEDVAADVQTRLSQLRGQYGD
jgi:predicted DNA-binding transcriptional regulator AlpA